MRIRSHSAFLLAFALLWASSTAGQQTTTSELILVPIGGTRQAVDGAFGSRWVVEAYVRNIGSQPISFFGPVCLTGFCPPLALSPGRTYRWFGDPYTLVSVIGAGAADNFRFEVFARDLSRQTESWGTEMPVVRERDLRSDSVQILRVPSDDLYRRHLRMYALWPDANGETATLRVRIYDAAEDLQGRSVLLGEREFVLDARVNPIRLVGYHSLGNLDELFDRTKTDAVRVVVEQLTGGAKVWAFVTLTNNQTQNVTSITPQP